MAVGDKIRKEAADRLKKEENFECPDPTTDRKLNTANRKIAVAEYSYGPSDPDAENADFWQEKAEVWGVSPSKAKSRKCGNCRVFDVTPWMQDCIQATSQSDTYIKESGVQSGYCRVHEFTCAATRTCDFWIKGGPMNSEIETEDIEEAREEGEL